MSSEEDLGFLDEGMQHVFGFLELRYGEDPGFTLQMNSNFNHSRPDERQRLPVLRRASRLNGSQLIARIAARRLGEPSQPVTAVFEPADGPSKVLQSPDYTEFCGRTTQRGSHATR